MRQNDQTAMQFLLEGSQAAVSNRDMAQRFQYLDAGEILELLKSLPDHPDLFLEPDKAHRFERAIPYLAEASRKLEFDEDEWLSAWQKAYALTTPDSNLRNGLLYWLAVVGTPRALQLWQSTISSVPPEFRPGLVWSFAPLLKNSNLSQPQLLSILEDALPHPQLSGCAMDLLNFRFREGLNSPHPAVSRSSELLRLMGDVAQQLARVEEGHLPPGKTYAEVSWLVGDAVALLIALCDFSALCQLKEAEGKLWQAASLRHRRVQVEALAALAKLDVADASQRLAELASEPAVRLRVIKYAQELGVEEKIAERYRSQESLIESQLANWLAEPQQMGIAPSRVEWVDSRRLFWPGFHNPVDCHLVRFTYGQDDNEFSNIGIVGPMIYAFENDLTGMSLDDIYGAFAGWQVSHEELYEISIDDAYRIRRQDVERQIQMLEASELEDVRPQFAANFLGEWLLIAHAERHGNPGVAIASDQEFAWYSDVYRESTAQFAYWVYRGCRLLKMFNEHFQATDP